MRDELHIIVMPADQVAANTGVHICSGAISRPSNAGYYGEVFLSSPQSSEQELQSFLCGRPGVKAYLALLFNGYRELLNTAMEAMDRGEHDCADIVIGCAKKDAVLESIGIPLLETQEAWMKAREQA